MEQRLHFTTTCTGLKVMVSVNQNCQGFCYWRNEYCYTIFKAVLEDKFEDVESFYADKRFVDAPLWSAGFLNGYTVLHLACMVKNKELVMFLIEHYGANVNVMASDGTQPIHLACLFGHCEIAEILLENGANIDAEMNRNIVDKFHGSQFWCDDFRDKMTMLTFAILYHERNDSLATNLIYNGVNLRINSVKNKTLVMYAFERNKYSVGVFIAETLRDREFINLCDNDGLHAIHYLLHPSKFKSDSYVEYLMGEWELCSTIRRLIIVGVNIDATINDDPDTLLLNIAAYRSSPSMLEALLSHYRFIAKSKALYNATNSVKHLQGIMQGYLQNTFHEWAQTKSIEVILKDLINRRTFGLPVPEEEINLMDQLITKNKSIKIFVDTYKQNFIEKELKEKVIQYDDKSISYYDIIRLGFNRQKLSPFVKHETFIRAFVDSFPNDESHFFFKTQILIKIKRIKLLDQLKNVQQLSKAIPLPFELILEIIDYFSNHEFETFIRAFTL